MIKSYKLELKANKKKLEKVKEILREYRKTAKVVVNTQLSLLYKNSKLNKNHKLQKCLYVSFVGRNKIQI